MSRVNRMVELKPQMNGNTRETLVSVGHRCENCSGNGWFWGTDGEGKGMKVTCPVCKGKAELDAVVYIVWKPTCKE